MFVRQELQGVHQTDCDVFKPVNDENFSDFLVSKKNSEDRNEIRGN